MKVNSHVNFVILTWKYRIILDSIQIDTFKNFLKNMNSDVSIYVIVCNVVIVFLTNENETISKLIWIRENASVFLKIDVSTFFNHENDDHVIDLMQNKKLFFESLYNMSQTKLKILTKYIKKNLIFNRIREFINSAIASILFIFKKNEELRLCVNYRNLNAITIKNRHSVRTRNCD